MLLPPLNIYNISLKSSSHSVHANVRSDEFYLGLDDADDDGLKENKSADRKVLTVVITTIHETSSFGISILREF